MKRILTLALTLLCLTFGLLTMEAQAAETSGTCGENVTWVYDDETKTLTISGEGDMKNYSYSGSNKSPWHVNQRIEKVIIEDGVTSIGQCAFMDQKKLTSVTIPDSVIEIGLYAFYRCSSLSSVTIPDGMTEIGSGAFRNCSSLSSVTIPDSVTEIGYEAFYGCSSLTSVTIPDSVTEIGNYAFSVCSSLSSVTIPDGVTYVGAFAFSSCSSLNIVTIPDSVTEIEEGTFFACSSLTNLTIPDSVTYIDEYAFKGCSSLTSVIIPNGMTYIGEFAFYECNSLTTVIYLHGNQEQWDEIEIGFNPILKEVKLEFHHWGDWTEVKTATCTEAGEQIRIASCCDASETEAIAANGHSYDAVVTDPDCINGGYTTHTCAVCEHRYTDGETAARGHSYDKWTVSKKVSCTEPGEKIRKCKHCDASETEAIATKGHSYDAVVTDPDCINGGYTTHTCAVCGDSYTDSETTARGHSYDRSTVSKEASCTEPGERIRTCKRCGTSETKAISAKGHTEVVDKAVEATCTETGLTEGKHCSVCDEILVAQTVIAAKGHSYVDGKCACGAEDPDYVEPSDPTEPSKPSAPEKPDEPEKPNQPEIPVIEFKDVAKDAWYAAPVSWAVARGVTNGIAEGQFGPDQNCTRAQVVTFLWRAAGSPEPASSTNPFTDVDSAAWYGKAVLWAVEKGITNGMNATEFGTDMTCTRAQVATFLWRAQGQPAPASSSNPFKDVDANAWYGKAVLWAVENGITNGMGEGTFAPDGTCTRGQIVTFLYRALK